MQQQVNLELMSFIEKEILPRYTAFGSSHGLRHVMRVIKNTLNLVNITGINIDMAYVIAAYHDLGMEGPRAIHHLTGGKIIAADARLKRWFTADQLTIMKEAIEDHRASASRQPRSIYGKVIAEADRDLEPDEVYRRAIEYGLENYPEKDKEEQWERFLHHLQEKYSCTGYIHLWIPGSPNAQNLRVIQYTIEHQDQLRKNFERIYLEIMLSGKTL